MRDKHLEGIDVVLQNLKNIQKLNGASRTVSVIVESNGKEKSSDPAYYGALHDENKFPFSEPPLVDFKKDVMEDERVIEYFNDMLRIKRKRRSSESMNKAAILMGKIASDKVLNYILYEMPQKPQPWKKSGERNLIESGDLIDAIKSKVEKDGKEIWRGY